MRKCLLFLLLGCGVTSSQEHLTDQASTNAESKVWVPINVDATVYKFDPQRGKLVATTSSIAEMGFQWLTGGNVTVAYGDDFKFVEYLAADEHWLWVHSLEDPRFVKRTKAHYTGPAFPRRSNRLLEQDSAATALSIRCG